MHQHSHMKILSIASLTNGNVSSYFALNTHHSPGCYFGTAKTKDILHFCSNDSLHMARPSNK